MTQTSARLAPRIAPRSASAARTIARALCATGLVLAAGLTPLRAQDCPQPEITADPQDCKRLWEGFGLPVSNLDERAGDHTYICHQRYLVRHNNVTRTPDWVIERLTREMVTGDNPRPSQGFRPDPCVPEVASATDDDYLRSRYARGHQAASADFSVNELWMRDTFYFSNAVPQEGIGFNSSIWKQLEEKVRALAENRGEIYVITGPIYQRPGGEDILIESGQNACGNEIRLTGPERKLICGGVSGDGPTLACTEGVAIPAALFKIVVDARIGRVNAYLLPNIRHRSASKRGTSTEAYLKTWRVSALTVQEHSGYTLLPEVSRHQRHATIESCPATMMR